MQVISTNTILYTISFFYMFLLSWNGIPIYSDFFRPYLIAPILLFLYYMIIFMYRRKIIISLFNLEDVFLISMLILIFISSIINKDFNSNYLLVYTGILLLFYFLPKIVFISKKKAEIIFKVNAYSVILILIITLFDFFVKNYLSIDFLDIFPRTTETNALYGGLFFRNYGFSDEPGAFAYYLGTMGVLGIWYLNKIIVKNKFIKMLVLLLFLLTYASTFSAGGIGAVMVGYLGVFLGAIYFKEKKTLYYLLLLVLPVFLFVFAFHEYLTAIFSKLFLSDTSSVEHRLESWNLGLNLFEENILFGIGAGVSTKVYGQSLISFYLTLIFENGLIAFLFFLFFLFFSFLRIFSYGKEGFIFLFVFLVSCVHLAIISTFYYPFLFLIVVMSKLYKVYFINDK